MKHSIKYLKEFAFETLFEAKARVQMQGKFLNGSMKTKPKTFENGPLAQWIRRRPPEPEIPGSSPGWVNLDEALACLHSPNPE